MRRRHPHRTGGPLVAVTALVVGGCSEPRGTVDVTVPDGASLSAVADSLHTRGLVRSSAGFSVYARLRGDARRIKAGRYRLPLGASWSSLLDALIRGRMITEALTVPEGLRLPQIAPRIAEISGVDSDSVLAYIETPGRDSILGLPGPGLEGYLFPDTYRFVPGVAPEIVVRAMVDRYRQVWTPARLARIDSLGLTERDAVTLASIVQAEARHADEMPRIASVYRNRLQRGWLLQADPTVLYALGGHRDRLLYAAIDSVAGHPYNTYARSGLPPGPIGAPGEAAMDAVLFPADEPYLYFVALPDGRHIFTRTLAEHNRAKESARRAWDTARIPVHDTTALW